MFSISTLALMMIVWMVLLANLPFITRRFLWGIKTKKTVANTHWNKSFAWCVLELLIYYGVLIATHLLVAFRSGYLLWQPFSFYAITFLLFIAMSFFGVCYRFLYRR